MILLSKIDPMIYVHYGNKKRYRVLHIALDTETGIKRAIYTCLDDSDGQIYDQPSERFFGHLDHDGEIVPRFRALKDIKND